MLTAGAYRQQETEGHSRATVKEKTAQQQGGYITCCSPYPPVPRSAGPTRSHEPRSWCTWTVMSRENLTGMLNLPVRITQDGKFPVRTGRDGPLSPSLKFGRNGTVQIPVIEICTGQDANPRPVPSRDVYSPVYGPNHSASLGKQPIVLLRPSVALPIRTQPTKIVTCRQRMTQRRLGREVCFSRLNRGWHGANYHDVIRTYGILALST